MVHTITAAIVAALVVTQSHKRNTKCLVNDTYMTKVDQICKFRSFFMNNFCLSFCFTWLTYRVFFFRHCSITTVIFHNRHRTLVLFNHNSPICQSNMSSNRIQCIIHWQQILMVPLAVCQLWTSISHNSHVQLTLDGTMHVAFTILLDTIIRIHCHKRAVPRHGHKYVIRKIPEKPKRSISPETRNVLVLLV